MNDWIDVRDELPPPGEEVLAYCPVIYNVTFWNGSEWDCMDDITHWMPLPDRPEDEA